MLSTFLMLSEKRRGEKNSKGRKNVRKFCARNGKRWLRVGCLCMPLYSFMLVGMKRNLWRAIAFVCAVGFAFIVAIQLRSVGGTRVIGRATAPDGTEMLVVQKCNWSLEPFTTTFFFRRPDKTWGAFYYDHEDWFWNRSSCVINTNAQCAVFYRAGAPAITYSWRTETYKLHRWNRTLSGAQWDMPADWKPF